MINLIATLVRKLYWLPGNYFIYRLVSKLFNSMIKTNSIIVRTPLNYKISVNPQKYIGNTIFWRGAHEWPIIFMLKKLLKENDTVLDIGANIGEITLSCASLVPSGRVYAFEPVSSIYDELQKNIALNPHLSNIHVIKQGVGNAIAEVPIYHDSKDQYNEGTFSMYSENFNHTKFIENIKLTTIDHFVEDQKLSQVNLMKIDVEGNEIFALQGAKQTLLRYHPYLIIELSRKNIAAANYHPDDIIAFLSQLGYNGFYIIKTRGKLVELKSTADLPEFCNILVKRDKV